MAAKDIKEMKAFRRAKDIRENLINQLNKCNSHDALVRLTSDYEAKKAKGMFEYPLLTAYHAALIQNLKITIDNLFDAKVKEFNMSVDSSVVIAEQQAVVVEPVATIEKKPEDTIVIDQQSAVDEPVVSIIELPIADMVKSPMKKAVKTVQFNPEVTHLYVAAEEPHLEETVNLDKEKHLTAVREQIKIIQNKAEYFELKHKATKDEKYRKAHHSALALIDKVENLTNQYARNEISLGFYKSQASELFDKRNKDIKELHTHRGWKEILVNALAVMLGTVFFLAAALRAGTLLLFKPATDSIKKVNALSNAVAAVEQDESDLLNLDNIYNC